MPWGQVGPWKPHHWPKLFSPALLQQNLAPPNQVLHAWGDHPPPEASAQGAFSLVPGAFRRRHPIAPPHRAPYLAPHGRPHPAHGPLHRRGGEVEDDGVKGGVEAGEEQRVGPPARASSLGEAHHVRDIVGREADPKVDDGGQGQAHGPVLLLRWDVWPGQESPHEVDVAEDGDGEGQEEEDEEHLQAQREDEAQLVVGEVVVALVDVGGPIVDTRRRPAGGGGGLGDICGVRDFGTVGGGDPGAGDVGVGGLGATQGGDPGAGDVGFGGLGPTWGGDPGAGDFGVGGLGATRGGDPGAGDVGVGGLGATRGGDPGAGDVGVGGLGATRGGDPGADASGDVAGGDLDAEVIACGVAEAEDLKDFRVDDGGAGDLHAFGVGDGGAGDLGAAGVEAIRFGHLGAARLEPVDHGAIRANGQGPVGQSLVPTTVILGHENDGAVGTGQEPEDNAGGQRPPGSSPVLELEGEDDPQVALDAEGHQEEAAEVDAGVEAEVGHRAEDHR